MCGAKLFTESAPAASATVENAANRSTTLRSPAAAAGAPLQSGGSPQTASPRTSAPPSEDAPAASGPSFLGLNEPEPAPRRRGSLSINPNSAPPASNVDYLLQDDEQEEQRGGGAGKFILILLALALAVGLGYLRWKKQGFGWLGSGASKPAATAQTSGATQPDSTTPSSTTSAPAALPTDAPPEIATSAPAVTPGPTPATDSPTPAGSPAASNPTPNTATGTAPANAAPAAATAPAPSGAASPPDGTAAPPAPAAKPPAPAAKPLSPAKLDASSPASAESNQMADAPPAKPTAAVTPLPKVDPVAEAQKYIYGRGVPQNCDRGLRLLKPAADQANPKAMIEMGALYSAGLCTPHDLPTAYRWFALALRKDPDNQSVKADLEKLWGEMTQAERQLAIKLSQ